MRLIDADKLFEYLDEQEKGMKQDGTWDLMAHCLTVGLKNGIDKQPTINPLQEVLERINNEATSILDCERIVREVMKKYE